MLGEFALLSQVSPFTSGPMPSATPGLL